MKPLVKGTFVMMLLSCTAGVRTPPADHVAGAAQPRAGIAITRIFTGPDGETHAEDINVELARDDQFTELSEMAKATGVRFRRQAPHYFEDWHIAPRRQYVITLSGRGEIEVSDGKKIPLGPGRILLVDDLTGKGHISRGVGAEERTSVIIPLAE